MKETGAVSLFASFMIGIELGTETTSWHENKVRLPVTDDVTDRRVGYCDEKSRTCVID